VVNELSRKLLSQSLRTIDDKWCAEPQLLATASRHIPRSLCNPAHSYAFLETISFILICKSCSGNAVKKCSATCGLQKGKQDER
jgi:hypothetical protein